MGPKSQLWSQMMGYEGAIEKYENIEQNHFSIDVESILCVPRVSGRVPGAPRQRKMMKNQIYHRTRSPRRVKIKKCEFSVNILYFFSLLYHFYKMKRELMV